MKNQKISVKSFAYIGMMSLGAIFGFFGSFLFWLSWIIAPVLGVVVSLHSMLDQKPILPMTIGIFLGGLPVWLIISLNTNVYSLLLPNLPVWITFLLQITTTPIMFLLGAYAHKSEKILSKL